VVAAGEPGRADGRQADPHPGPSSRRFRWQLALVAMAALAWRVGYVLVDKRNDPPAGDAIYYSAQARLIARGHWFIHPVTGGPAADHPPLTALLLAPADWLDRNSVLAQRLLVCTWGAAVVVLIAVLARRLAGEEAGIAAAVIAAVYANLWMNDGLPMSETFSAAFILVAIIAAYRYADRPTPGRAALMGAAVGLSALARAEMLLLVPLLVIPLAVGARRPSRQRLQQGTVAIVAVLAVNAPWAIYNLSRFEEPVLMSTNEGLTYRGANCDETYYTGGIGYWSLPCALNDPPPPGDESQQSAYWRRRGIDYALDNLSRLPKVAAIRVLRVWGVYSPEEMVFYNQGEGREPWASWVGIVSFWVLAPVAVAGGVVLRRRRVLLLPLLVMPVIVTAVAVWFYGIVRFRLPAELTVVVLAGAAVAAGLERLRARSAASAHPAPSGPPPRRPDPPRADRQGAV
jgi:4-amino-4-deoxy-L-arabinose transferase-like glycosyltransferase